MRYYTLGFILAALFFSSCADTRIHEKKEWGKIFSKYGVRDGCFIMRDHTHEEIYYYNKERSTERFLPASTFKIFNALVALETAVAPDDQMIFEWDGVERPVDQWNRNLNLRQAFEVSCVPCFQQLARGIGKDNMQHYLDTAQYGNRTIGGSIDSFWLNNSLKITADEQVGLVKKLYFDELPFSERSQRIVRSMMLREDTHHLKLYYKTGTGSYNDSTIYWIVGFAERIEDVHEPEASMNKSNIRMYPYFFAQNFSVKNGDNSQDWQQVRMDILKEILYDRGVIKELKPNG